MYKDKKILAFIPARGGSKGIPNKNIIELCGKPLIQYSIEVAKNCSYIDDVVVSTDSEEIAEMSKILGARVPFLRPAELAGDTSRIIDSMIYTVNRLIDMDEKYDYVVLLQPTQPIRTVENLEEAIEKLINSGKDSLVSVCSIKEHPILMRTLNDEGDLKSLLGVNSTVRRQDFPDVYKVNGSIYINKLNEKFNENTSLNDNVLPYFMSEQYSVDIDSVEDLKRAEEIIESLC